MTNILTKDELLTVVIGTLKNLDGEIELNSIPEDKWNELYSNDSIDLAVSEIIRYIDHHIIPFLENSREELTK